MCNINAGVHACAPGADVSLTDVTIAQMGNGAGDVTHRNPAEDLGDFEVS